MIPYKGEAWATPITACVHVHREYSYNQPIAIDLVRLYVHVHKIRVQCTHAYANYMHS